MTNKRGGGRGKDILSLIDSLDNKNLIIVDLLLEIVRLRKLLKLYGLDPSKPKNDE